MLANLLDSLLQACQAIDSGHTCRPGNNSFNLPDTDCRVLCGGAGGVKRVCFQKAAKEFRRRHGCKSIISFLQYDRIY